MSKEVRLKPITKNSNTINFLNSLATAYVKETGAPDDVFPVRAQVTELRQLLINGRAAGDRVTSLALHDYKVPRLTKGMVLRVVAYTANHAFLYIKTKEDTTSSLFHWEPESEDAFPMLQLMQPESWHDDVYVFGNTKGLAALGKACTKAAKTGIAQAFSAAPADFETADINVIPLSIATADALPSPYAQNPHGVLMLYPRELGTYAFKISYPKLLPSEMLEWVKYRETCGKVREITRQESKF